MLYDPKCHIDHIGSLLLSAADVLESENEMCPLDAISEVSDDPSWEAVKRLERYLGEWPAAWFDNHSKAEAVTALRKAAEV